MKIYLNIRNKYIEVSIRASEKGIIGDLFTEVKEGKSFILGSTKIKYSQLLENGSGAMTINTGK